MIAMRSITKQIQVLAVAFVLLGVLAISSIPAHADASLNGWQKGILVQPTSSTDYSSANFQQSMRNAQADGVNYVTLVIPLRQTSVTSSDIYVPIYTPTDQSLASGIQFIHSLGMGVSISLHDDPNDGQWRALINPTDRTSWFANYGAILDHYADIAQANNAEELLIATEMSSLTIPSYSSQNTPGWIAMIQTVRTHFKGLLTYGAEHGGYMADDQQLQFWSYLDEIGISAYYSMGDSSSSVADMENNWAQVDASELKGLASTYNKPLIFIEAGYVSGDNALGDPGSAYLNAGAVNMAIQANAYQALLSYWSTSTYMRGVSFWDWSVDPNAGGAADTNYTPQNKPAEQVMKQWFTGNGEATTAVAATYALTSSHPTTLSTNALTTNTVNVSSGQALYGDIIDIEVYDATGKQLAQKFYENQDVTGTPTPYQITWTPPTDGTYTVRAGIFTANWQSNITWNSSVASLSAITPPAAIPAPAPMPVPTPPPAPAAVQPVMPDPSATTAARIDIWWPGSGASVSGIQPFKALIDNVDQSSYTMYWQVDGGQLNAMYVENSGGPHQEADVDVSDWNWHGNGGTYTVNFVAKDATGTILARKSTTIAIYH
jgi:hypothetical protein